MKKIGILFLCCTLLFEFTSFKAHRFYTAIFQINYVQPKKMVQITTRIFVDDLNNALKNQFHKNTYLGTDKESAQDIELMKKYFADKFKLSINGKFHAMNYLSKDIEDDVVVCYLNIKDISKLNTLEIENSVIVEIHPEQQNIIQFNDNGNKKSLLLSGDTIKGMLK